MNQALAARERPLRKGFRFGRDVREKSQYPDVVRFRIILETWKVPMPPEAQQLILDLQKSQSASTNGER
ncbi:MAG: hypothetical protein DMG96_39545 [Acidobacteria bacterium]|nr:MAG: hypothetical protein DMG96_39545 [Acidobacteriota bacterium]